jgi:hypothetical protein
VRAEVRSDRIRAIPALEDTLVAFHLAVLAARPWHGAEPPAGASLAPGPGGLTQLP